MPDITGVMVDLTIIQGRDLVPKDRSSIFSSAKSSDPYVKVTRHLPDRSSRSPPLPCGQTNVVPKTLAPRWDKQLKLQFNGHTFDPGMVFVLEIFDKDKSGADDPMGEVSIEVKPLLNGQAVERWMKVEPCKGCNNATGELQVKIAVLVRSSLALEAGKSIAIDGKKIAVGLSWDRMAGNVAIDLDTACVAVSKTGGILKKESVYFAQLASASGAIHHSGDEQDGAGDGDDEVITVDLSLLGPSVAALFFIGTVASEGRSFADVKTSTMRVSDPSTGAELFRFSPAIQGAHTALMLARVARHKGSWVLTAIGEYDHSARDWGTLVPEIKGYMGDLVPGLVVNASERVALMRKGGAIRVRDYCEERIPDVMSFGLAWDITNGKNIDLDASAIMLDSDCNPLDVVFFGQKTSKDGAIVHGGDEREGDAQGDDEQIFLKLAKVHPSVAYIGFVINSYSGEELDDVEGASCHLFDPARPHGDLATFALTNTSCLDKHTALVLGMLYRQGQEWGLVIFAEAAQGRTAQDNIDELQACIRRKPPPAMQPPSTPRKAAPVKSDLIVEAQLLHSDQPIEGYVPVAVPMGMPVVSASLT